jgi:hypothetical protein
MKRNGSRSEPLPLSSTILLALAFAVSGCAHLTFQTQEQWERPWYRRWFAKRDGIRYYRPKPYLLVTQGAAEQPKGLCAVEIRYLPDYSQQYVIVPHYWIGSVALKPTLTDGWNLTGLDSAVDTKIPETLGAIAGLGKLFLPSGVARMEDGGRPEEGIGPGLYPIEHHSETHALYVDVGAPVFRVDKTCAGLTAPPPPKPKQSDEPDPGQGG